LRAGDGSTGRSESDTGREDTGSAALKGSFSAYRINEHCSVLPGFPGWSVCMVTHDEIVEDSDLSAFASSEPDAHEWLHCMAEEDFELI